MAEGHSRKDFQDAAERNIADAILLLASGRFSNAYYLAGYAVEMGLKACIARRIRQHVIPPKKFIEDTYKHRPTELTGIAGLTKALKDEQAQNPEFATNWGIAGQWSVESRYEFIDQYTAQLLINAIVHPANGVLPWVKKHW